MAQRPMRVAVRVVDGDCWMKSVVTRLEQLSGNEFLYSLPVRAALIDTINQKHGAARARPALERHVLGAAAEGRCWRRFVRRKE